MRKRNRLKTGRGLSWAGKGRKILLAAVAGAAALSLLYSFIFGEMGLVKYYRMKVQYDDLTRSIATLQQDNAGLIVEVHALKTDPDYIEQIARDKLGLARPGEIVYYYDNQDREIPHNSGH